MKAIIIANGNINNIHILENVKKNYDFILAVDGGTNHCVEASVLPDLIIGDLDSISKEALKICKDNNILVEKFPAKKDWTDTELAIEYLIDKGFTDITLVGVTGSRMDHTLGNILLLSKIKDMGAKGRIIDENNVIYLTQDKLILDKEADSFISLIPITNSGINVSLKGFEYELENTEVKFASTFCISNKITEEKGIITIHRGEALVFISKD